MKSTGRLRVGIFTCRRGLVVRGDWMKAFIALTVASLATTLVSFSARAGGLAVDAAGNPFVADPSKHSVFKYTPDGTKSTFATGLKYPLSVCFDGSGNLFVSDGAANDAKTQHSILKFDRDGRKSTFATGISSAGMAFDRSGNLFVSQGDSIFKFIPKGVKSTFVTSKGANFIDLAFDEAGNLFVVDQALTKPFLGRSIIKITPDGAKSTFAAGLEEPRDLTVDATGNVYVSGNHAILRLTPDGTKNTFSSARGADEAWDLAVDRSGNVFVRNDRDAVLKFDPSGTPTTFAQDLSPDKQWEYNGWGIVKAGKTQVVLDLDQELEVYGPETEILWAPDSKRFGFNYSPLHAHHTTYETVALYQLRDDKWVALHSPVDKASERAQFAQLAKDYLPKGFNPRHCAPEWDELKLHKWTDANTAILYAPCYGRSRELKAAILFTLKFDDAGNWKIIKTHQMSDEEIEKGDAGEDVSGPAKTTDQEGLSADASFREADRHLNEVYNALRARLSPSERDRLKKEQLAWIDRRNAAAQAAKGNAQENPTDAADREVTKMTLARAAELEKRLKTAK